MSTTSDPEHLWQLGDLRREVMLQALLYVHGSLRTGPGALAVSADELDAACCALADSLRSCPNCVGVKHPNRNTED